MDKHGSINFGSAKEALPPLSLLRLGLLTAILLTFALAAYSLWQSRENLQKEAAENATNLSKVLERYVHSTLHESDVALQIAADEFKHQVHTRQKLNPDFSIFLNTLRQRQTQFQTLSATDSNGLIRYGDGANLGKPLHLADRQYLRIARETGFAIDQPQVSHITQDWIMPMARSLETPDGEFAGVVIGNIETRGFSNLLASLQPGKNSTIVLFDTNATVIMRHPEINGPGSSFGKKLQIPEFLALWQAGEKTGTFSIRTGLDGVYRTLNYRQVGNYPLYVMVGLAEENYLAPWHTQVLVTTVFLLTLSLLTGVLSVTINRSLKKQRQALQAESTLRKLSLAVEQSEGGIMITDAKGRIEYANKAMLHNSGYRMEELLGQNPSILSSGKTSRETYDILWAAMEQGQSWQGEFINKRMDGQEYTVYATITPLRQPNGLIENFVAVEENITELKMATAELNLYRHHLEQLVQERTAELQATHKQLFDTQFAMDSVGIAIQWVDTRNGHLLYVNNFAAEMLGYSVDEMLTLSVPDIDPNIEPESFHKIAAEIQLKGHVQMESTNRTKDGQIIPVQLSIYFLPGKDGDSGRFIVFITNISKRKEVETALEEAKSLAESANRAKGAFLANMSHEIRTPINAVLGFAHLCLNLELPARAHDYVSKIRSATETLLSIVNDILDFSKIEAGKMTMETIPFDLGEVLSQIANLFNQKAREKGIELVIGALPGIPDPLIGDPLRLGQVLTNLVSNAIKFTDHGEISVTVEPISIKNNKACLRFTIRDSGLGMTQEQQSRLFTAFSQADSSTTRKYGGTGLGLTISKQLVEAMEGEFTVDSQEGVGSCFSFSACFELNTEKSNTPSAETRLGDKRVLVIDDNAVMRTMLSKIVEALGCQVHADGSGEAALRRLESGAEFDIILLDWRLPGLDGAATARRIRELGQCLPIILITGDDLETARNEVKENDIQAFLSKPISRSTLSDTISKVLSGTCILPKQATEQRALPELKGMRILLVDDNDFNREVGRELINMTGAAVDTVNDGKLAVQAVTASHYDLVLMDLQMPVMDGYTATRVIRENHPELPILALTAHAMIEEKGRVLAAGMNAILTKPILPHALYAALARWLPQHQTTTNLAPPSLITAAVNIESNAQLITPPDHLNPLPGFDLETALTRVNGSRPMLDRFLRMFRERNAQCVDEINAALQSQDIASAQRLAHALKGGAGTVGMLELQAAAAQLERLLAERTHDDIDYSEDLAALQATWKQTVNTLSKLLDTH